MHRPHTTTRSRRKAFTLIELIVVISILVILVSITAASMNWTAQKDRIPNGANEVASFTMGARDRAIFRRSPTGVRLILNQDGPINAAGNPITVSSMMYIGSPEEVSGTISIEYLPAATSNPNHRRRLRFWSAGGNGVPGDVGDDDMNNGVDDTGEFGDTAPKDDVQLNREFNDFARLSRLGLLDTGVQISLRPGGSLEQNFTLIKQQPGTGPDNSDWLLSADYTASNVGGCMDLKYTIKPLPAILPNQEPRDLPRGVVIDLESSRRKGALPPGWVRYVGGSSPLQLDHYQYSDYMDIIFSPRGTGFGSSGASGLIHLVLAESADVERTDYPLDQIITVMGVDVIDEQDFYQLGLTPEQRPNAGQERVVTINPSSGKVSVSALQLDHPTSPPLPAGDPSVGIPIDPFRYAEVGKSAP